MNNKPRRQIAYVNISGTSQMHLRHPLIIAWWSAAFPGFGHLLLSKYLRGFLLIGWEMYINTKANLNLAIIYSFNGQFVRATEILDVRWMSLYAPVYLYAIYDSYRTTIDLNHIYVLAKRENAPFSIFVIGSIEINYLEKRTPRISILWSLLMPGMGQLYIHRIITAFFVLCVWIGIVYQSHFLQAMHFTMLMRFTEATTIVDKQWILFLPSIYGFALYDAYVNTVENNKLFEDEQKNYLKNNFQNKQFHFPKHKQAIE